ncbi:hypothetical protein ATC00_14750 [Sinorhizobium americanum]|uniref:hypothetical protein n=1 Tax=Sinorhizobium americanum TaxID=194963 RepID=UPI0007D94EC6|nr:hypothetical protein [Sinorhizobium americanum]OAP49986.1 hypothetical protein ATC00_14750 [Sinorhizobium americanum]
MRASLLLLVQWHIQKAPISAQVIVIRSIESAGFLRLRFGWRLMPAARRATAAARLRRRFWGVAITASMLAIGQRNAPEVSENAKPEFVVRVSTIDVGIKRAMSHGRRGIDTVQFYSGFDGAFMIEITCKDAFHAVIPHPFLELACPMKRVPSSVHEMDVRLPASGPPSMTGVLISTRP